MIPPLRTIISFSELGVLAVVFSLPGQIELGLVTGASTTAVMVYAISEFVTGVIYGVLVAALWEAIGYFGRYCDTFRGAQYAEQAASITERRSSALEEVLSYLLCVVFFSSDAVQKFFRCLYSVNAQTICIGAMQNITAAKTAIEKMILQLSSISINVLSGCIGLGFCVLAYELSLGVAARVSGKAAVYSELSALKVILGLVLSGLFFVSFGYLDIPITFQFYLLRIFFVNPNH